MFRGNYTINIIPIKVHEEPDTCGQAAVSPGRRLARRGARSQDTKHAFCSHFSPDGLEETWPSQVGCNPPPQNKPQPHTKKMCPKVTAFKGAGSVRLSSSRKWTPNGKCLGHGRWAEGLVRDLDARGQHPEAACAGRTGPSLPEAMPSPEQSCKGCVPTQPRTTELQPL